MTLCRCLENECCPDLASGFQCRKYNRYEYLVEACGSDKQRMADLAILLANAAIAMRLMKETGTPVFDDQRTMASSIMLAIEELQQRVRRC